jgi:hypothetical protein
MLDPLAGIQREIERAEAKAQQVAYAELREQVRMALGAPRQPSRGNGPVLALVLALLGLILMLFHPAPAIACWAVAAYLYLASSDHLKRDRAAIRAADAEAERRWRRQQLRATGGEEEEGAFTAAPQPPGPPRPAGSEPRRRG